MDLMTNCTASGNTNEDENLFLIMQAVEVRPHAVFDRLVKTVRGIAVAVQRGNAASELGTVGNGDYV